MMPKGSSLAEQAKLRLKRVSIGGLAWKIMRTCLIIGVSYVFLFPLLYMLSMSIRDPASVNDPSVVWFPKAFTFSTIKNTLSAMQFFPGENVNGEHVMGSFLITLSTAVFSTMATLVSCSLVGYGFARYSFPGKKFLFAMVILTIIVPPQIISLPLNASFAKFPVYGIEWVITSIAELFTGGRVDLGEFFRPMSVNILNTEWTFIIPSLFAVGLRGGLFIFIFRQFFLNLPKELEEAARIDGCGPLKTFMKVIIPIAVPAFVTVTLFSFVWHWNDYHTTALLYSGDHFTLTLRLKELQSALQLQQSVNGLAQISNAQLRLYMQAGALVTIVPPLFLYILTQRFFTESIERTGLVG